MQRPNKRESGVYSSIFFSPYSSPTAELISAWAANWCLKSAATLATMTISFLGHKSFPQLEYFILHAIRGRDFPAMPSQRGDLVDSPLMTSLLLQILDLHSGIALQTLFLLQYGSHDRHSRTRTVATFVPHVWDCVQFRQIFFERHQGALDLSKEEGNTGHWNLILDIPT